MGAVPDLIANSAINKTLRSAVKKGNDLLPIIGGQSLSETPGSSNVETVQFFLITESYPGDEQPGQFQFGWRLTPGNPIDDLLISAGRDKTAISLDFRAPGAEKGGSANATQELTIGVADAEVEGLSTLTPGDKLSTPTPASVPTGWGVDSSDLKIGDGTFRIGNVVELITKPTDEDHDLWPIAAIKTNSSGLSAHIYTKPKKAKSGADAAEELSEFAVPTKSPAEPYAGFKVYDPNVVYQVSGTGISYSTDSSGIVPIGQLTMTVDTEPVFELIRHEDVDKAYQY